MTIRMRCQDKERLVAYLYEDGDAVEREAIEAHLADCAACASELQELQGVRRQLAEWSTPEIDLGFRVVREPVAPPRRPPWSVPAWAALPVAAMLLLAVGAALASVELRYDSSGFTLRTGWNHQPRSASVPQPAGSAAAPAAPASTVSGSSGADWRAALTETERKLRTELAQTRTGASGAADVGPLTTDRDATLRLVRSLIDESERRQQREFALRLAQFAEDVEAQRRADLLQIDQNVDQIEGLAATQHDMMNYIVRVSQGQ